ncbi:MAG: porin [Sideroxydans sp.]
MQKKLIALAVAAAFSAPAFADTTVYGIADLAIANVSGGGGTNLISGGLSTSRFGVKHTEGLDNGMTAVVVLEYALDVANKTALGSNSAGAVNARQQMLALAGDFGTVAAGFLQTAGYDFSVKYDPTAGSAVDTAAYVNTTAVSSYINSSGRAAHAAAYISPDLNGLKIAVNRSFDATNATAPAPKLAVNLLSVNYSAGPLSVGGAYAADDAASKTTEYGLGASYALKEISLFGTYNSSKTGAGNSKTAMAFHAVAPVASLGTVVFTYGQNNLTAKNSGFTLALLKDLSKTTTGYGAIEKKSVSGGTDTTILAVGLRKKF